MRFLGGKRGKINATVKNNSRSPFDFALGRLFGMTTKRANARTTTSYLEALFFFAVFFAGFFGAFFVAFFFDFFDGPVEAPGLITAITFVPMGEPRPEQASQPGPALKPTGVPT